MNESDFDAALANFLAPPRRAPDRLFAARVDSIVGDVARLHAAERRYMRGIVGEFLALAVALVAGISLVRAIGEPLDGWPLIVPAMLVLLVLLSGSGRQPWLGSSPAP